MPSDRARPASARSVTCRRSSRSCCCRRRPAPVRAASAAASSPRTLAALGDQATGGSEAGYPGGRRLRRAGRAGIGAPPGDAAAAWPQAPRGDGVLEITRIVYNGPLTPRATAAITKALLAARR